MDIDGSDNIEALEPTVKDSTFRCELIVQKDQGIETALEAGTSLAVILTLNSTGPNTMTGNWFPQTKTETDASDETKVRIVPFEGVMDDITVTA